MALTSLENATAVQLQKRKDDLNKILTEVGSQAMVTNDYNINYVSDTDVASTLIFNPLVNSKFDNSQIKTAVNKLMIFGRYYILIHKFLYDTIVKIIILLV